MKTKHTPGPWKVAINKPNKTSTRDTIQVAGPVKKGNSEVLYSKMSAPNCFWHDRYMADAHLIAAAPTLLETLEVCIAMLDPKRDADAIVIRAMKNAIAKAKGDL